MSEQIPVSCNICGGTQWADLKQRKKAQCKACGSRERTRLLWMHIKEVQFAAGARILHLAPEPSLYARLTSHFQNHKYQPADLQPERYGFASGIQHIDLCSLNSEPSDYFDLIIHSHVLEHIPCNIAYTLFHIHRMLKPSGLHMCVIPFLPGSYDESFETISDEERARRFGQFDHVRRFGVDDVHRHVGSIIKLPETYDAERRFGKHQLEAANIPSSLWHGFTTASVLELKKEDYRLAIRRYSATTVGGA